MIKDLIMDSIPPYPQIIYFISISVVAILTSGILAGALKRYAGWKTGYTRKTLHFLIFFTAAGLHFWGGMPAVNILGTFFSNPWPAKKIIPAGVILSSYLT